MVSCSRGRPQLLSGWKGRPASSRHLCPAGPASRVFFLPGTSVCLKPNPGAPSLPRLPQLIIRSLTCAPGVFGTPPTSALSVPIWSRPLPPLLGHLPWPLQESLCLCS
ncbi:hypothetical protein VULLAG_LOCUS1771 [Vulpes lagopus]